MPTRFIKIMIIVVTLLLLGFCAKYIIDTDERMESEFMSQCLGDGKKQYECDVLYMMQWR